MRPYTPNTDKGRTRAGADIHHRTADLPRTGAKVVAKAARHGARQDARGAINAELADAATPRTVTQVLDAAAGS